MSKILWILNEFTYSKITIRDKKKLLDQLATGNRVQFPNYPVYVNEATVTLITGYVKCVDGEMYIWLTNDERRKIIKMNQS